MLKKKNRAAPAPDKVFDCVKFCPERVTVETTNPREHFDVTEASETPPQKPALPLVMIQQQKERESQMIQDKIFVARGRKLAPHSRCCEKVIDSSSPCARSLRGLGSWRRCQQSHRISRWQLPPSHALTVNWCLLSQEFTVNSSQLRTVRMTRMIPQFNFESGRFYHLTPIMFILIFSVAPRTHRL